MHLCLDVDHCDVCLFAREVSCSLPTTVATNVFQYSTAPLCLLSVNTDIRVIPFPRLETEESDCGKLFVTMEQKCRPLDRADLALIQAYLVEHENVKTGTGVWT